jgi:proline dehydrogenase
VSNKTPLSKDESVTFEKAKKRVQQICKAAHDAGVSIHIDAEESWIQPAIDDITLEMMALFNKEKPIVFNTLQMYLKDRLGFLKHALEHAKEHEYICAVKLVRGAYMEKERRRAAVKAYPSPIHETLEDTHRSYNMGLKFCIENIDHLYLCNATHNQESCAYLAELMEAHKLPSDHPHVSSAQLYGMSDNLSYNLAKAGYQVEKYLPYGPVKEVIPYLIRRTKENSSVGGQMSRELSLIKKELKRRKEVKSLKIEA